MQRIRVGGYDLSRSLFFIAGPCVIENEAHCMRMAERLARIRDRLGIPLIFKASYDKANRASIHSFRGPGIKRGLQILRKVKREIGLPLLSDVHEVSQVGPSARILDVLQIPAFLSRQTDLVVAAARTGKVLNLKKGQFLAPWDVKNMIEKARTVGNERILLTERGTTWGYNNLVVDFRSFPIMQSFGYPVIFDVTHSVQVPGGAVTSSSGQPQFIEHLARAGAAVGVNGFFLEVHDNPARALSDGASSLPLKKFPDLVQRLLEIHAVASRFH